MVTGILSLGPWTLAVSSPAIIYSLNETRHHWNKTEVNGLKLKDDCDIKTEDKES